MDAQVRGLLTFDREDPDQHDQPFRIHERLASVPVAFDRREMGGLKEFEKVLPGLADSLGGDHAGGAGRGHGALISANNSTMLPS